MNIALLFVAFVALVAHVVYVGRLFSTVENLAARDELFRKNQRKRGYSLRSSALVPGRVALDLSQNERASQALRGARVTAALMSGVAVTLLLRQVVPLAVAWCGA